jgi:hypothetical protein
LSFAPAGTTGLAAGLVDCAAAAVAGIAAAVAVACRRLRSAAALAAGVAGAVLALALPAMEPPARAGSWLCAWAGSQAASNKAGSSNFIDWRMANSAGAEGSLTLPCKALNGQGLRRGPPGG